ncbi:MAG TPA: dephospho-CoA kinase, partial [Gemmatimonadales bacterium]|nr:dephospho-CoA kinase [Gemmatimonadales bacterium]
MYQVGLTGNVAAGKSSVAALLRDWGASVIDADAIVRTLQRPGTPVFRSIVSRFGPGVVGADGALDRTALRTRILARPEERALLEGIVHPAVEAERQRLLAQAGAGDGIVVSDIPLLFETMDPSRFDAVVLVDAPEPLRVARLTGERGLAADEASALMRAQMPAAQKRPRADFVIENDAGRDALREHTWTVWRKLLSRARAR